MAQVSLQSSCLFLPSAGIRGLSLSWCMDNFNHQTLTLSRPEAVLSQGVSEALFSLGYSGRKPPSSWGRPSSLAFRFPTRLSAMSQCLPCVPLSLPLLPHLLLQLYCLCVYMCMMCVEVGGQLCRSVFPFNLDMIPGNKT